MSTHQQMLAQSYQDPEFRASLNAALSDGVKRVGRLSSQMRFLARDSVASREAFPLENLKMVGTLQQQKNMYALIKTPDNNLYRVRSGDYIGQNFGRITDINETAVKLKELVQDSGNDWKEEERTLLLQE